MSNQQLSYLHPLKIVKTEAVYIGHIGVYPDIKIIVKKVIGVKMNEACT